MILLVIPNIGGGFHNILNNRDSSHSLGMTRLGMNFFKPYWLYPGLYSLVLFPFCQNCRGVEGFVVAQYLHFKDVANV